ncbi:MAG TPA: carboxypeptidase-like regulatory domain-containing protein, partial [Pyrinomonadaceae bacterium]
WGLNNVGQVGDGAASANACTCRAAPVQTAVGAGNAELGAGWFHAFALRPVAALAAGANQILYGDNLRLSMAEVTGAGDVAYSAVSAATVAGSYTLPSNYTIETNQPAYDVTTTAATNGTIDVCLANLNEFNPIAFASLRILHGEGGAWVDRTQSANFMKREICARVSTLSPFVIATVTAPPTAANVSVSGRVTSDGTNGISNATVTVTDADGTILTTRTGSFGYYKFPALPAGRSYVVGVTAKRYRFVSRIVSLEDAVENFDFEALGK